MEIRGLYLIADPEQCAGRDVVEVVRLALRGGARLVQYRDKLHDKGDQLLVLERLRPLCRDAGVPLVVNDHVDLALAAGVDGVHVGQHDLPVAVVRRLLPAGAIIGCSTNNPDEARAGEAAGATYVAVGRLFPTRSKTNTRPAALDAVRQVKAAIGLPLVGIGGIDAANVDDVIAAGANAAAVIAAVCGANDVEAAARAIASHFRGAAG